MDLKPQTAVYLIRISERLLFLSLVVIATVRTATDGSVVIAVAGGAAMLAWFFAGPMMRLPRLWLAGLAAGWLALSFVDAAWVWLSFSLFLLCLTILPTKSGFTAVAVITVLASAGFSWHQGSFQLSAVVGPAIGASMAIVVTSVYLAMQADAVAREDLVSRLLATQQQLRDQAVETGMLAERERLSREIHDTVAQGLSSIVFQLQTDAPESRDLALTTARHSLEEARRLVRALSPADLDGRHLSEAIERVVDASTRDGMPTTYFLDGNPYPVPTAVEVVLLRVTQGALANVRNHANAGHATVSLTYQPSCVRLDVADDGRGFDPAAPPVGDGSGTGLASMRRRLREVGGSLDVESAPGEGTALSASVPVWVD